MSDIVNIFSIPSSTSSVVSAVLPPLTVVGGTIFAAVLGATIFKWYDTWHNAELASRALSGLTSNFARHCKIHERIYDILRFRRTIFNVNDFKLGSRKIFYVLSF
jgi:hypothetical protein